MISSLDPDFVQVFLENFHELYISGNPDSRLFCMDLNTALYNAPLTNKERSVITRLYFNEPTAPIRSGKRGHPTTTGAAETSFVMVGNEAIEKSTLSIIKKSAVEKIAAYLGAEYDAADTA